MFEIFKHTVELVFPLAELNLVFGKKELVDIFRVLRTITGTEVF